MRTAGRLASARVLLHLRHDLLILMQLSNIQQKHIEISAPRHAIDSPSSPLMQQQLCSSQFEEQYKQQLAGYFVSEERQRSLLLKLLKQEGIEFDERYFQGRFNAQLYEYSSNYEVIKLRVSFGYFRMDISVLIIQRTSLCHNFLYLHHNSQSSVFLYEDKHGYKTTIKCLGFQTSAFPRCMRQTVKEVCLTKIAGILGIGPKTSNLFGFNIVVYTTCIEFAIQHCQAIHETTVEDRKILEQKLALLHKFSIVHMDIKPSNIMFDSSQNQIVFIDFGLSKHVREEIGHKSRVRFSGSLLYCGNQMRKAYKTQNFQLIDLYYNDLVCLNTSLLQLENEESQGVKEGEDYDFQLSEMILIHYKHHFETSSLQFAYMRMQYHISNRQPLQIEWMGDQLFINKYLYSLLIYIKQFSFMPNSQYYGELTSLFGQPQELQELADKYVTNKYNLQNIKQNGIYPNADQSGEQQTYHYKICKNIFNNEIAQHGSEIFCFRTAANTVYLWLLDQKRVRECTNTDYLEKCYIEFVDFSVRHCSWQQKVICTKIIAKRLGKQINALQDRSILSQCQKQLLLQIIERKGLFMKQTVPILIRNLIILNGISSRQIVQICKTIYGQSIDTSQKFELKVKIELILLFYEHQNFEYISRKNLTEILKESYHIKVQQPYLTILYSTHTFFMQNIFDVETIRKQFRKILYAHYFSQKFIEQLIIWKFSYVHIKSRLLINEIEMFLWMKLEIIQNYFNKYCICFDFMYLPFIFYFESTIQEKLVSLIYSKMKYCIEDINVLKMFNIYYYQKRYEMKKESLEKQIAYHIQNLEEMVGRYVLWRGEQLQSLEFIMDSRQPQILQQVINFCILYQAYQKQFKNIVQLLKRLITEDILPKIAHIVVTLTQQQKSGFYWNSNGSLMLILVCFIYWMIYKDNHSLADQLNYFYETINRQIQSVVFHDQLTKCHYQYNLLSIKRKVLELRNQDKQLQQYHQRFIHKYLQEQPQKFERTDFFNRPFLIYIDKSLQISAEKGQQAQKFYYQTVIKNRQFKNAFATECFRESLYHLNHYCILYRNALEFFGMHLLLSSFLGSYPYNNYIQDYLFSFIDLKLYQQELARFRQYLNQHYRILLRVNNSYIIIFYAFLLNFINCKEELAENEPKINRFIIAYICRKVSSLNLQAKKYVLGNLYEYLYVTGQCKHRCNRKYVKYKLKKIGMQDYKKAMGYGVGKSMSEQQRRIREMLKGKLKNWYRYTTI